MNGLRSRLRERILARAAGQVLSAAALVGASAGQPANLPGPQAAGRLDNGKVAAKRDHRPFTDFRLPPWEGVSGSATRLPLSASWGATEVPGVVKGRARIIPPRSQPAKPRGQRRVALGYAGRRVLRQRSHRLAPGPHRPDRRSLYGAMKTLRGGDRSATCAGPSLPPHEQIVKTSKRSSSLVEAWLSFTCAWVIASRRTVPPSAK